MISSIRPLSDGLSYVRRQSEKRLESIEKELDLLPRGMLSVNHKLEKTYFVENDGHNRKGISGDPKRIHQLARRKFLELQRKQILAGLRSRYDSPSGVEAAAASLNSLLDSYAKVGLDISRITLTPKQYEWMHQPYRGNDSFPDQRQFKTNSDIRVRSNTTILTSL